MKKYVFMSICRANYEERARVGGQEETDMKFKYAASRISFLQGTFPHGIDILTACDYYAVGNRSNTYLNLR